MDEAGEQGTLRFLQCTTLMAAWHEQHPASKNLCYLFPNVWWGRQLVNPGSAGKHRQHHNHRHINIAPLCGGFRGAGSRLTEVKSGISHTTDTIHTIAAWSWQRIIVSTWRRHVPNIPSTSDISATEKPVNYEKPRQFDSHPSPTAFSMATRGTAKVARSNMYYRPTRAVLTFVYCLPIVCLCQ